MSPLPSKVSTSNVDCKGKKEYFSTPFKGDLLLVNQKRSYDEALQYCANRSSTLVQPRNIKQVNFLKEATEETCPNSEWLIGVYVDKGTAWWSDGEAYNGELVVAPDSTFDDDLVRQVVMEHGVLKKRHLDTEHRFICQEKPRAQPQSHYALIFGSPLALSLCVVGGVVLTLIICILLYKLYLRKRYSFNL